MNAEIGDLRTLSELLIGNNKLSEVPPEIAQLNGLLTLDVSDNAGIKELPLIGSLRNLQVLLIKNLQLTRFPPDIFTFPGSLQLVNRS